jgi:uncharacterized coiled-coil DUF342 family protein
MNTAPTPTPETLAIWTEYLAGMRTDETAIDGFKLIEHQRDEARETIASMEIRHAAVMLHTQTIVDEANEIRDQRDKLTDACRNLIDVKGRHNTEIAFNKMKDVFQSLKTKEL